MLKLLFLILLFFLVGFCVDDSYGHHNTKPIIKGLASWYNIKSNFGTTTASGIPLDENAMTAASRYHKMGTKLRVTNLSNNKSVVVTVTDWGPHPRLKSRVIDLTIGAFKQIADPKVGLVKCKVEIIKQHEPSE